MDLRFHLQMIYVSLLIGRAFLFLKKALIYMSYGCNIKRKKTNGDVDSGHCPMDSLFVPSVNSRKIFDLFQENN